MMYDGSIYSKYSVVHHYETLLKDLMHTRIQNTILWSDELLSAKLFYVNACDLININYLIWVIFRKLEPLDYRLSCLLSLLQYFLRAQSGHLKHFGWYSFRPQSAVQHYLYT